MRTIICTLFLTSAIFLNFAQLSSQSRPPPRPVGEPYFAEREVQTDNEVWLRVRANQIVPMPNRGYFRARYDGLIKMFYEDVYGIIDVEERGTMYKVHPGRSELGMLQWQEFRRRNGAGPSGASGSSGK